MQNENKQSRIFLIGFSLIILIVFWFLLKPFVLNWKNGGKNLDEEKANAEILKAPSVMSEDLFQKIQNKSKVFLVDISSSDDFARGHITTSVNVSEEKLDKAFFKSIGADTTGDIFIINQGSDLVNLATIVNKVISSGYVNAKYLRGGVADWQEKGFPLVSSGGSDNDSAKVKKISIDEIKKEAGIYPDQFEFLDVRNKDIFGKEHIVGALNIPLAELESRKDEISAVKKVVVYGASENDSFQAAVTLFDLNFFNIYQMQGIIDDWKTAGGNVENN